MMYRKTPSAQILAGKPLSLAITLPLIILIIAILALGFTPQLLDWLTIPAVQTLLIIFGK